MGVRFPSVASTTLLGPLPANTNETVVLVTPPLNLPLDFAQVFISWWLLFTGGATTTFTTFRIRRGTTTGGTQVNPGNASPATSAGSTNMYAGSYVDTPGAVGAQQYALTVVQGAATGAGNLLDGCISVFAL